MYAPLSEATKTGNLSMEELNEEEVKTLIPAIIYVCILMACGVIGNAVVIYVYCFRFKASNHRYFILTLGICDFITSAICMPFLIVDMLRPYTFTNIIACKSLRYITYNTALVSIFTLFFIAVERYRKICRPFDKQITLPLARRILFVIVLLTATVFALPSSILFGRSTVHTGKGNTTGVACFIDDNLRKTPFPLAYNITLLVIVFFLGAAMVYCYSKIALQRIVRAKARRARKRYCAVDNNDYILSSDPNGYDVPTSVLDGLKEEYISATNKRSRIDGSCTDLYANKQTSHQELDETRNGHAKRLSEKHPNDIKNGDIGNCHIAEKNGNEDISYTRYIDKTNNAGESPHVESRDVIPDNYISEKDSINTLLTDVVQKRVFSCISLNENIDKSRFRECELFPACTNCIKNKVNENQGVSYHSLCHGEFSGTDNQYHISNTILHKCLPRRAFYNTKCLSVNNVLDMTKFTLNELDVSDKRRSASCDTLCLESRISCHNESLSIPEIHRSSEEAFRNYTLSDENKEIIETDKNGGFLPETQNCDFTQHSHAAERSQPNGVCPSQKIETERCRVTEDTDGDTTHGAKLSIIHSGSTQQLNGNINKIRKTKQNNHCKKMFIKRNFTKSAKFAEGRDASVIRVTKMLFVITLVYFLSFIPHLVLMNVLLLDDDFLASLGRLEAVLYYIALRSFVINAVANPFVYNFMDRKFRKECRKILNRRTSI